MTPTPTPTGCPDALADDLGNLLATDDGICISWNESIPYFDCPDAISTDDGLALIREDNYFECIIPD
jgi:hypothetical protein